MFGTTEGIVNQLRGWRLTGPKALSRALAATLFPPRCCLCGFRGATADLDLCEACHTDLPWNSQVSPGVLAPLRYEYPVDDMIRRLKYQGQLELARIFGVLLASAARARARASPLPRLLLPVPLHGARLRERGFNQAYALARYAGRLLEVPYARTLVRRVRDTPSQTALDVAARRHNVRGAFAVCGPEAMARLSAAEHVAVIDDVITTGSTTAELRAVLLAAGVRRVEVWAAARALPSARDTPATSR
jgi:ComF family protein